MERYIMFIDQKFNIIKMSIFPRFKYRFSVVPVQNSRYFCFVEIKKLIQFIWKFKETEIVKTTFEKE